MHNQQDIIEYLAIFQNRENGGDDLYINLVGVATAAQYMVECDAKGKYTIEVLMHIAC